MRRIAAVLGALLGVLFLAESANAQVLIWSLPEKDGSWVKLEGTYRNKKIRPQAAEGDQESEWRSELTIKSVGEETLQIDGKPLKCRWLEFKTVIGKPSEAGVQPGPSGTRMYKVLVDETKIDGKIVNDRGIPNTFFPIIKGYRKLGNGKVETISEKSFNPYTGISMITHYPDLKAEGDKQQLEIPGKTVTATLMRGTQQLESTTVRSRNEGELWLSPDVPFGLAKFVVKVTQEKKDSTAPKDDFKRFADVQMEMAVVQQGTDARSEVATP